MANIHQICQFLEHFAPSTLAEAWDNVGLLIGDRNRPVHRLMTCLTVTDRSADEAVEQRADLIVTHHPLPFHATKRVTTDTPTGRLLLRLIEHRIAVYSPHTAFDSAQRGINQRLAEGLGLSEIRPLVPRDAVSPTVGTGRWGTLPRPESLERLAERTCTLLGVAGLHVVGPLHRQVLQVAVACGSAGELVAAAHEAGCEVLVVGEARFHTALEAQARNVALILPGHFASERLGVEQLAGELRQAFPSVHVWASQRESDPLVWITPQCPSGNPGRNTPDT